MQNLFIFGLKQLMYYAIQLLQHGPTNPLSPQPPPPGVWLGGWEGMTKVKNGVQAQGLGPWGLK